MNDMTSVIVPKSDQINADDLIPGPMTITIREVQIKGGQEQPVSIFFDGSDKAFRPCKSMSRVLVAAWGPDAKAYVGRSLTLYRDPTVKWGGMEVGGIRISHMTHIDAPMTMALTATKGSRKPYTVKPLTAPAAPTASADPATKWAHAYLAKLPSFTTTEALETFAKSKEAKLEELRTARPDLHEKVSLGLEQRRSELAPKSGFDDFDDDLREGPADDQRGEAVTLADALDEIAAAAEVRDVNRLVLAHVETFAADEADKIRNAGAERCDVLLRQQA